MRRVIVVVPEWLGADSVLAQKLPSLQLLAELGTLTRLAPMPNVETPEAIWLGMPPGAVRLAQGPLTVSALGADPPERSTHFHVSLMSFEDGIATRLSVAVPEDQIRAVTESARRLNTKSLTFVPGEGTDHGLVWEDLGDIATTPAQVVDGNSIRGHLPEGDAERPLRAFIDDSVNLLSELDINSERTDEGLPPLNLLWPWGHGVRGPVPNLALRRGEPATVYSTSLRMAGLVRLCGYRHADRAAFGRGLNAKFETLAQDCLKGDLAFVILDSMEILRQRSKLEEAAWLSREIDQRLFTPILDSVLKDPGRLTVVAPRSDADGLAVSLSTGQRGLNAIPFDERALEERSLAARDVWSVIEDATQSVTLLA